MENNTMNKNNGACGYGVLPKPAQCGSYFTGNPMNPTMATPYCPNPVNPMQPAYGLGPEFNMFNTHDAAISAILSANLTSIIGNDSSKEPERKNPAVAHRVYILPELTKDRQIYDPESDKYKSKCSDSEKELINDLYVYHATGKYAIGIWEDRSDNRIIFDGEEYAWDGRRFKACKSISIVTGKISERILEPIYNVGTIIGFVDKETERFRYAMNEHAEPINQNNLKTPRQLTDYYANLIEKAKESELNPNKECPTV